MRPAAFALALLISMCAVPAAAAQERPADAPLVRMRDGHGSDLLFRVHPRGKEIAMLGSRGDLVYTWVRRTRTLHVIDVRDGRTVNEVHTSRRIPNLLAPRS
jgi:hypothetical protein